MPVQLHSRSMCPAPPQAPAADSALAALGHPVTEINPSLEYVERTEVTFINPGCTVKQLWLRMDRQAAWDEEYLASLQPPPSDPQVRTGFRALEIHLCMP